MCQELVSRETNPHPRVPPVQPRVKHHRESIVCYEVSTELALRKKHLQSLNSLFATANRILCDIDQTILKSVIDSILRHCTELTEVIRNKGSIIDY